MTIHPGTGVRLDAEGRANFIRDAMEGGEWTRAAELKMMREWSVTAAQMVASVRKARGLIEEALPSVVDLRAEMIVRLRRIIATGEDRDAIKASAEVARLVGASAPDMDLKQHLAIMTIDERRAYLTRLRATVDKALEALQ